VSYILLTILYNSLVGYGPKMKLSFCLILYIRGREPLTREPVVAPLMTPSPDIFLNTNVTDETFCDFPTKPSAPEVALTVRSMLLKRKFRHLPIV